MARDDWFRHKNWDSKIEAQFFDKLHRARRKAQYLRVQASYLTEEHPRVALALIEKYFALHDHFDDAQAFVSQSDAYLSLGETDAAIQSLQRSLQREREFPNVKTQAWSNYALLIATHQLKSLYDDGLRVLRDNHLRSTSFPVEQFLWNATHALIIHSQGKHEEAKRYALRALQFAELTKSGFQYHPDVGLVGNRYDDLKAKLRGLVSE
jgi:tetratricopeptide (TPR) repeat protein